MIRYPLKTALCAVLLTGFAIIPAFSQGVWDLTLPLPSGDPDWQEVKSLWNDRWGGKNIHELILRLHRLEEKGAEMLAVNLWLSQAYYLKGRYEKKDRVDNMKRSETHAARAVAIDEDNTTALKLLITSVSSYADLNYIEKTYGPLFMKKLPVPAGRALPELDGLPGFKEALADWDQREDFEKGAKAVRAFRRIADDNPDNLMAQLWVCRGNYYLGYHHISFNDHDAALPFFREGNDYGVKALALDPHHVPANYWRQLNLSRSIENANLLVKARHMNAIMNHLVLTANENATYFYCGPLIATATIIEKGGWVAEKGLGLAGYTIETVAMGLELATLVFPTYFYTHFAKAEVLYHMGRKDETEALLRRVLTMDPYENPWHAPENLCVQRLAALFLAKHYPAR